MHQRTHTYFTGVLQAMAATTAARGGQSGGLVTVFSDGSTLRERYVPFKRADVGAFTVSLSASYTQQRLQS
jgi:hypothetical protein